MSNDITGTYQLAKDVFNSLSLKDQTIVSIPINHQRTFRKHLVEMQKRQESTKRFATRLVNKTQLKITRIE